MSNQVTSTQPLIRQLSLVITAGLATAIWRAEVEYHGWAGLIWLSYFHIAIPIGVVLFAVWLSLYSNLPSKPQRFRLAGIFLIASVPLDFVLTTTTQLFFVMGPSATIAAFSTGFSLFFIMRLSILIIYPAILLLFWAIARWQGLRLNSKIYLLSSAFFLGAWPLAMIIAPFTGVPGDAIHTIKSGNLFFFMTVGLGIPLLAAPKKYLQQRRA